MIGGKIFYQFLADAHLSNEKLKIIQLDKLFYALVVSVSSKTTH